MTRIFLIITRWVLAFFLAILFSNCHEGKTFKASGKIKTETRKVKENFTNIEVSNAIQLVIVQSKQQRIIVTSDENMLQNIRTVVKGDVLKIYISDKIYIKNTKFPIKVMVYIEKLEAIEANAASNVTTQNQIVSSNFSLEASSAANVKMDIQSENVNVNVSSAAIVNIRGLALHLETTASSGGVFEGNRLKVNDIEAEASSGGHVEVYPILNLDANVSSGGSIDYYHNPKTIDIEKNSGGNIANRASEQ